MSSLLQYNERLMKTGLSKDQSNALIEVLSDMHDNNLVSKAEFNEFKKGDFNEFKIMTNNNFENLRKDLQALGDRLTIRLSGVMAVMLGILYTLQKLN